MKRKKYEITVLSLCTGVVEKRFEEYQKEGWELAGNITPFKGNNDAIYLTIPLKSKQLKIK